MQNVREENGHTILSTSLDLAGRETIEVTYPGIASDRVVNGAEVVIYGYGDGVRTEESRLGETSVALVLAAHIEPLAEGSPTEQAQRILRRARHH